MSMRMALELRDAIGKPARIKSSLNGKHRVLYKDYAFWWASRYNNYRGWKKNTSFTPYETGGGYDKCIGNFKDIKEVLEFLEIEYFPDFQKAAAAPSHTFHWRIGPK